MSLIDGNLQGEGPRDNFLNEIKWKYRGGATWQNGSYDPELDLVYWGTGNAELYNPAYRGGADSLYTASVIAIRPKTGELVRHYQRVSLQRLT